MIWQRGVSIGEEGLMTACWGTSRKDDELEHAPRPFWTGADLAPRWGGQSPLLLLKVYIDSLEPSYKLVPKKVQKKLEVEDNERSSSYLNFLDAPISEWDLFSCFRSKLWNLNRIGVCRLLFFCHLQLTFDDTEKVIGIRICCGWCKRNLKYREDDDFT